MALFLFDVGRLYSNGADRQKARPLLERSLSLLEQSVGPDHPWTATTLCELGVVLTNEGDYVQADTVLHRALAIQEKALAPDDPDLGMTAPNAGASDSGFTDFGVAFDCTRGNNAPQGQAAMLDEN